MSQTLEEARIALRERQGRGARHDAALAPSQALDWARLGTAYFARLLNDLSDHALDEPSAVEGFSRRRLVAYAGYHARLLSEFVAWGRAGVAGPFPRNLDVAADDLEFGITQPSRALRYLFDHSAVHLNVEWRDLSNEDWGRSVADTTGRKTHLRDTPLTRARKLWLLAIDLNSGGRFADMPAGFVDFLILDQASRRLPTGRFALVATDRAAPLIMGQAPAIIVRGTARDLVGWLSGKGVGKLSAEGGALPALAPRPAIGPA
ncbi:maleylpyruvate isomerase N-terminal domain-containing protein [Rhizobium sp. K102]|uniref:maleylpyruvate isomerase N-terminal domain-containing protein n=1 Tax=Rhizobium sp. K102 TaxID=2918527 RepID=UPI001EFAFAE6|nr:maleylpyruvate isomerase N-terminal domain-containing protein [Rhizobium sp. K102]ULR44853.1 maleylpyruvate isomerase N-terminal domain-containing protein [Rhizobium sp. K102]